jgi:hypothetical protein
MLQYVSRSTPVRGLVVSVDCLLQNIVERIGGVLNKHIRGRRTTNRVNGIRHSIVLLWTVNDPFSAVNFTGAIHQVAMIEVGDDTQDVTVYVMNRYQVVDERLEPPSAVHVGILKHVSGYVSCRVLCVSVLQDVRYE